MKTKAWIIGIIGLWLITAAFLEFGKTANLWNNLLIGLAAASVGYMMLKQKPWQAWTTIIVSVWLIIAAFIPTLIEGQSYLWNDLVCGILLAIAGFASMSTEKAVTEKKS